MVLIESFSGIRGIYEKEFTLDVARKYAQVFEIFLKKENKNPKIVIGRDTRLSGEIIEKAIANSLSCEIINVGVQTTPIIENAVRDFKAEGGIIITASHNEPEYNGLKLLDKTGAIISSQFSEQLIKNVKSHSIKNSDINKKIFYKNKETIKNYINLIKKIIGKDKLKFKDKIIIDPNGGSAILSKQIFEFFRVKCIHINTKKAEFKRKIEPNQESLNYLSPIINKNKAVFGVGFDCDADRAEILLKNGILVSGNHILALLVQDILSKSKNAKEESIVVNDATSYLVKEICNGYRANFIEVEAGETNVVEEMLKNKSKIGGEGSNGGVILAPTTCRDGILTTLYLLKILEEKNETLENLITNLPKYYYKKEKISLSQDFSLIRDKIKSYYSKTGFAIQLTGDESGGLKAIKNNSWIWFRQSKTESNQLRIIADSKSEKDADNLLEEAKNLIETLLTK